MPTPAIAFLTESMRCDAGIMISASHNPYYDNGIKFFDNYGNKLDSATEQAIESIVQNDELIEASQQIDKGIGKSKRIDDVIGRYIVHIKSSFPKALSLTNLRIVVDCANGAGYKVAPTIFSELGADVITVANEPNGYNINEGCGAMHPEFVANAVLKYRADVGIALDGDADRLVLIDEKGNIVDGDKLMGVLALHMKNEGNLKNDAMVATVMSNQGLEEFLTQNQIKLYRSAVGDKNVVELMNRHGLNFGGEQSGHIVFSDYAKTGDGLSSALQALAYLVKSKRKASEVFNSYESYPQLLVNLSIENKKEFENIEGYQALVEKIQSQGMRHLFRYSGTENKIRLLLEGKQRAKLEKMMEESIEFFKKVLD